MIQYTYIFAIPSLVFRYRACSKQVLGGSVMYNDLFSIGPFTIHSYGVMIAIGALLAYQVVMIRAKKYQMDTSHIDTLFIVVLLSGFIGSKVLYFLTEFDRIMQYPNILFDLSDGYVVYGGIIGGIFGGYLFCRNKQIPFLKMLDLAIPSMALAQGFGRIGCFLAGCCYGMETTSAIGVVYPSGSLAPSGVSLLPTQIISSIFDFALFFLLIVYAKHKKTDGQVSALYLIFYSIGRFIIEFFRGDLIRGSVGTLSTSQFISIFVVVIGIGLYIYLQKKKVTNDHTR